MGDVLHNVEERGKITVLLVCAVYAVVDSDKPHALFFEHDFGIKTDFQIITPKAAHVLYNNCAHISGFNLCNHGLEALTLESCSAYSVICEVPDRGIAVFMSVAFKKLFLIFDTVALAYEFIISA